jgi:hypothetical protein
MARPWEANLQNGAIQELKSLNFGMLLNLQETGEHAHCGPGNLPSSGFTYSLETIMQAGIGFYHMPWPDMSVPSLPAVMKICQVMQHVCQDQGRRIAVHCHAGLGRTGLAIACYLVYSGMCPPAEAILRTRSRRPGALQTPAQALFVHIFQQWLRHLQCVCIPTFRCAFSDAAGCQCEELWDETFCMLPRASLGESASFVPTPPKTLREVVARQKHRLHGQRIRHYWNVPELLVQLLQARHPMHPCTCWCSGCFITLTTLGSQVLDPADVGSHSSHGCLCVQHLHVITWLFHEPSKNGKAPAPCLHLYHCTILNCLHASAVYAASHRAWLCAGHLTTHSRPSCLVGSPCNGQAVHGRSGSATASCFAGAVLRHWPVAMAGEAHGHR